MSFENKNNYHAICQTSPQTCEACLTKTEGEQPVFFESKRDDTKFAIPIKQEEISTKMEFEGNSNFSANFYNAFLQQIYIMSSLPNLFANIKYEYMPNQQQLAPNVFPKTPLEMRGFELPPHLKQTPHYGKILPNNAVIQEMKTEPTSLKSSESFTQLDLQILTKIKVPRLETFSEEINTSLIKIQKKLSAFSFFSLIFTETTIKRMCDIPPESNFWCPLQEINVFLARLLLKSTLAHFTSPRTDKCELMHIFKRISSYKLKAKLQKIHRRFQEISLQTSLTQGETLHRLVYDLNNSLREVYCPSQNLVVVQRVFRFARKQVKILMLIEKTGFVNKFAIKFTKPRFTNQEILGLFEGLPNDRTYCLHLEEGLFNVELFKALKVKKINAFSLFKSKDLKNKFPYSCELVKRSDGLLVCVINEVNVITNLNERGIVMSLEEQENINENDVFSFFKQKYAIAKSSHKRRLTKKMKVKTLYEKIVTFFLSVCMKNAFILADVYGDERFRCFNFEEFQMQALKGLMGKNY